MQTMRAVMIDEFGGPERMRMGEAQIADPAAGFVQVRMVCASINPADWKSRAGWMVGHAGYNPSFPLVLGFDGAGVVWRVGAGVTRVKPGDRVTLWTSQRAGQWGSYAEYVNTLEIAVAVIPDTLTFEQAATLPIAGQTAWQDLFYPDRGALTAGQRVFIHGGSGGLGSYAIQFAHLAGVHVATSCSQPNHDYVRALGAERAIDYRNEDLLASVRRWAPDGVDAVIDAVGMNTLPQALDMLHGGGTLVRVATMDRSDLEGLTPEVADRRGVKSVLARRAHDKSPAELDHMLALMASGRVRAPQTEVIPIENVAAAHRLAEASHVRGKLVLKIADPATFGHP